MFFRATTDFTSKAQSENRRGSQTVVRGLAVQSASPRILCTCALKDKKEHSDLKFLQFIVFLHTYCMYTIHAFLYSRNLVLQEKQNTDELYLIP